MPTNPSGWPANTLIWTHGTLTLRIESALSEQEALTIANSLR